jgi:thiol-disulfide isomerase/thioredoxin
VDNRYKNPKFLSRETAMEIHVYGKEGCKLCKSASKKLQVLLKRWDMESEHEIVFMDMETEYGAAEGDFFDVFDIPTVLVMEDKLAVRARWDGQPSPPADELYAALSNKSACREAVA